MHFDLMTYIMHFFSSCIQKDATVQTQRTQSTRSPLIGTSFRLGHVLRLCLFWSHNSHCTFLPLPSMVWFSVVSCPYPSHSCFMLRQGDLSLRSIGGQGRPFKFLQDPATIIYLSTQGKREYNCKTVRLHYSIGQCTVLHRVDT